MKIKLKEICKFIACLPCMGTKGNFERKFCKNFLFPEGCFREAEAKRGEKSIDIKILKDIIDNYNVGEFFEDLTYEEMPPLTYEKLVEKVINYRLMNK